MRNFLDSVQLSDLIEGVDTGRETSMKTENLSFDYSGQGQVIEKLGELFPDVGISILSQTFIIEAIPIQTHKKLIYEQRKYAE